MMEWKVSEVLITYERLLFEAGYAPFANEDPHDMKVAKYENYLRENAPELLEKPMTFGL